MTIAITAPNDPRPPVLPDHLLLPPPRTCGAGGSWGPRSGPADGGPGCDDREHRPAVGPARVALFDRRPVSSRSWSAPWPALSPSSSANPSWVPRGWVSDRRGPCAQWSASACTSASWACSRSASEQHPQRRRRHRRTVRTYPGPARSAPSPTYLAARLDREVPSRQRRSSHLPHGQGHLQPVCSWSVVATPEANRLRTRRSPPTRGVGGAPRSLQTTRRAQERSHRSGHPTVGDLQHSATCPAAIMGG